MKEVKVEKVNELIEYKLYKKLSAASWNILSSLDDENKLLFGTPFMKSIDTIGSNISKGFCHLDNNKKVGYYLDAIATMSEGMDHWLELMLKRNVISKVTFNVLRNLESPLKIKLESRISSFNKTK